MMVKFRDNLYIGNYKDPTDEAKLKVAGITAILNVAFEIHQEFTWYPEDLRYMKVGLSDDDKNKDYMKAQAVDCLIQMLLNKEIILVHCAAGLSRSVWVACEAIATIEGKDIEEVFKELKEVHPWAQHGSLFTNKYIPIGAE